MDRKIKLYSLIKSLSYLKFVNEEIDGLEYSVSPIIGNILGEIIREYNTLTGKDDNFTIDLNSPFGNTIRHIVPLKLSQIDKWDSLDTNIKEDILKNILAPYTLKDNEFIKQVLSQKL